MQIVWAVEGFLKALELKRGELNHFLMMDLTFIKDHSNIYVCLQCFYCVFHHLIIRSKGAYSMF